MSDADEEVEAGGAVPFGILEETAADSSILPVGSIGLESNSELPDTTSPSSAPDARNSPYLPSVFLRMPNTAWGICLGLAGQSMMWKAAENAPFLSGRINNLPNTITWWAGLFAAMVIGVAYTYKVIWHLPLVQDEYNSPPRVHFMNGPNLTLIMLSLGVPNSMGINTRTLQYLFAVGFCAQTVLTQFVYEVSTVLGLFLIGVFSLALCFTRSLIHCNLFASGYVAMDVFAGNFEPYGKHSVSAVRCRLVSTGFARTKSRD
jgi:hypothetical protein